MYVKSPMDVVGVLWGISLLSLIGLSTQDVKVKITGPTDPVPVGSSVTLKCEAQLGSGDTLRDMSFDNKDPLPMGTTTNPQRITVVDVQKSDAKQYRCSAVAYDKGGSYEAVYTLQVTEIQVEITAPTGPVFVGSSVHLECEAQLKGNARLQSMSFGKDDEESDLTDDGPRIISILSVQKHHAGKYRCSATSAGTGDRDTKLYNLSVLAPPKLEHAVFANASLYPLDGSFETAAWLAISGDIIGPHNFTAPHGMSLSVGTERYTYKKIPVTIYNLIPEDVEEIVEVSHSTPTCKKLRRPSGLYHFGFINHPINVTFKLDFLYRATWGGSSRNLSAYVGETDVYITCDVCANPNVTYEWMLNLYPLNITSRTLIIEKVGPSDFGVYNCTATNTINDETSSNTFSISLTEDKNKALDMGDKGIDGKPGGDTEDGGGSSMPVYVYPIIAGVILLLLVVVAVFGRRRRRLKEDSLKEGGDGPTVMYKKTPAPQTEIHPSEPIYENGPANQRPQRGHVANTTEPSKKPELTYCQLDFDNHVSGKPEKDWRAPGPRAADEYTEYAEIKGTLDRGKTSN